LLVIKKIDLAENRVAKKFKKAGIVPFPEVDLKQAAKILGCRERDILYALQNWKLAGRNVHGVHLIRIVDLFYFAVSRELKGQ